MRYPTVALSSFALWCAFGRAAGHRDGPFRYPDDEHVIITQYGPVRYEPVTADELNRPHDDTAGQPSPRGYYKAEVIPLDMNTWKPVPGGGATASLLPVAGGGGGAVDAMDVPLSVGYSVRPPKPSRRRGHGHYASPGQRRPSAVAGRADDGWWPGGRRRRRRRRFPGVLARGSR